MRRGRAPIRVAPDDGLKLPAAPQSDESFGGACVGPVGGGLASEILVVPAKRMTFREPAAPPTTIPRWRKPGRTRRKQWRSESRRHRRVTPYRKAPVLRVA